MFYLQIRLFSTDIMRNVVAMIAYESLSCIPMIVLCMTCTIVHIPTKRSVVSSINISHIIATQVLGILLAHPSSLKYVFSTTIIHRFQFRARFRTKLPLFGFHSTWLFKDQRTLNWVRSIASTPWHHALNSVPLFLLMSLSLRGRSPELDIYRPSYSAPRLSIDTLLSIR